MRGGRREAGGALVAGPPAVGRRAVVAYPPGSPAGPRGAGRNYNGPSECSCEGDGHAGHHLTSSSELKMSV